MLENRRFCVRKRKSEMLDEKTIKQVLELIEQRLEHLHQLRDFFEKELGASFEKTEGTSVFKARFPREKTEELSSKVQHLLRGLEVGKGLTVREIVEHFSSQAQSYSDLDSFKGVIRKLLENYPSVFKKEEGTRPAVYSLVEERR